MINRVKSSHIEMPLIIGASQLKNNSDNRLNVNTDNFSININIQNDKCFKNFLRSNDSEPFMCSYNIKNDKIIEICQQTVTNLLDFSIDSKIQDFKYSIYKKFPSQKNTNDCFQFSFKIQVQLSSDKNKFEILIEKQNLNFQLLKISSNVKFVKNSLLLDLLDSQFDATKGLLTMDQNNRLLFMQQNMKFPVIGFWLRTQKSFNSIQIYEELSRFVKQKYNKKCLFKLNSKNQKYFYFVKVSEKGKKMETFLVSWTQRIGAKKSYQFEKNCKIIDIKWQQYCQKTKKVLNPESSGTTKNSIPESSGASSKGSLSGKFQQNGMDFTLRESKQSKVESLESLINYSYLSPIKQLQHNKQSQNLFSQDCQNSPQFSTLCKQNQSQNQCLELRVKVKQQQTEIKKLRQIISIMQSELKLYKNSRMSTNCESSTKNKKFSPQIDSPNSFPFSESQRQNTNGLSPQDIRRLRQSDLNSNSVSRSDFLKNSSNQRSNRSKSSSLSNSKGAYQFKSNPLILQEQSGQKVIYGSLPKINEEDGRDPWDYMEIIQD